MLCAKGSNSTSQASPEYSAVSGQNTLGEAGQGWCGGSGGDDECADVCRCRRLPVTNGELPVLPVAVVPTLATSCHCSHPADHGWKYEIIPYLVSTSLHLAAPRPAAAIFKTSKWVD